MIRMFLEDRWESLTYVDSNKQAYDVNTYGTYQWLAVWPDVWTLVIL